MAVTCLNLTEGFCGWNSPTFAMPLLASASEERGHWPLLISE